MKPIAILLNLYIIFTTEFNVTKLVLLSTAKDLKYSMKYTDFRRGDTQNLLRMFKFALNILNSPKMVFDSSVTFGKLLDQKCQLYR